MGFAMARNDFHRHSGAGHHTGTMNPPREDQSAGQETVQAETTGGLTPPIRTQTGLPANQATLRDRGEHGSQAFETRRRGRGKLAAAPRFARGAAGGSAVTADN